jgi:hypothetical protein
MADGATPVLSDLLHNLAEALQASGTYLTAARRINGHSTSDAVPITELIEKATSELVRAQKAFHCLRAHLSAFEKRQDQKPEDSSGRATANFASPLASTEDDNLKKR